MTPGAPRKSTDQCEAPRSRTEDHGAQQSTCLFNDYSLFQGDLYTDTCESRY